MELINLKKSLSLLRPFAVGTLLATLLSNAINAAPDIEKRMEKFTDGLRPRYVVADEMPHYKLEDRMAHYGVPGVAVGIIKGGRLVHAQGFGVLQRGGSEKVDANTLFSAGSVSKVAAAALLLKQHAAGQLNIDADIERYLKSWTLPTSDVRAGKNVTLRMLLSHTGGFNIHGFGDFQPGAALPTVYDTLNGAKPAEHDPLTFLFAPGTRYKYSGGGYTLAQLIVTEISGKDFPATAKATLLEPLGMTRSSFQNPLPETVPNVAKAHNREGEPDALPRGYEAMPEMAASGLWTSAHDLGRLIAALIRSYQGQGGFLPQSLAIDMMTEVSPSEHGLGPRLEGTADGRFFHHGGANNSYRTWIEGHLATGDGLVVLTNGSQGNGLYREIRNAAADAFDWKLNQPVHVPAIGVSEDVLKSYVGKYSPDDSFPVEHRENMIGWIYDDIIEVTFKGGKLILSRDGSTRESELVPAAPNRFLIDGFQSRVGLTELVFHRDSSGQTKAMTFTNPGARSFYNKTSVGTR